MVQSEFQVIPIEKVVESPTNPRRRFNEQKMQDLIQSVREKGVLVPLLVRAINTTPNVEKQLENIGLLSKKGNGYQKYEILAGARRYRAAKTVGLLNLPAIVKKLDDNEALEIQIFENEQREDVHPLEQATGYKRLVDRNYTVPAIAAKLGCSESHVYKRLKLLDLIEPVQEAFLNDEITSEHAILIARLQPKDQEKAFAQCFEKYNSNRLVNVKSMADWIESNIHLDLKSAPFKIGDEDLLPAAGSCVNCPKRTGFNAQLFPDIQKKDTCTDGACFKKKLQACINQTIAGHEEKGKPLLKITRDYGAKEGGPLPRSKYHPILRKEDSCKSAQNAIVVSGHEGKGKIISICADPDCKIHKKQNQSSGMANRMDYQKQQKVQEEKAKKEQRIREDVFDAIIAKSKESDWIRDDWNMIALALLNSCDYDAPKIIAKRHDWAESQKFIAKRILALSIENLMPVIVELCLIQFVRVFAYDTSRRPEIFINAAKRYEVDIAAIEKKIAAELRSKTKPTEIETEKKGKAKAKKIKPST